MMKRGLTAACVVAASLATTAASAQEVTVRVADSLPTGHYIAENMTKVWMDRVAELTDGKVDFEYYPAQQLGKAKDLLSLTQTGVTDVGYVGISYVADQLPLSTVGELPEAFSTSCKGTLAYWSLAKPGGTLDEVELKENGVRMLFVLVLPPYQIFTKSQEITGASSFEGLKLRATGGTKELAVKKLGAVPVAISAPETREALSRGTIDGVLFPASSIGPYDLTSMLSYATKDMNFGSFIFSYMISQEKWDQLPKDVQKAMADAGDEVTKSACQVADKLDSSDKDAMAKQGVSFVALPEADKAQIDDALATIGTEWASGLDGRGKPGTEVLKAFREALANKGASD
ncbi:TRAP transporter substrate-binding protein DctP [Amorphus sp. 3PC139-8]